MFALHNYYFIKEIKIRYKKKIPCLIFIYILGRWFLHGWCRLWCQCRRRYASHHACPCRPPHRDCRRTLLWVFPQRCLLLNMGLTRIEWREYWPGMMARFESWCNTSRMSFCLFWFIGYLWLLITWLMLQSSKLSKNVLNISRSCVNKLLYFSR